MKSGVAVGVIVLLVVGIVVAGSVYRFETAMKDGEASLADKSELVSTDGSLDLSIEEGLPSGGEKGTLRVDPAKFAGDGPLGEGERLTQERLIAARADDRATRLARQEILDSFEGAPVEWGFEVLDVTEQGGTLRATLRIPWQVRMSDEENAWRNGVEMVRGEFPEDQRGRLLKLRNGDRVQVAGTLRTDGKWTIIEDARMVADK